MSPPAITPQSTFELPELGSSQRESAQCISFSAGSTDSARFEHSKAAEKPRMSSRSRPRLMKMRRRQVADGNTVNNDLGLKGFSDDCGGEKISEGKFGDVFGINNGNLGSNGVKEKSSELNENVQKFGNGFDSDVAFDISGLGKFTSMFGFDKGSSDFMQKETGGFVFGAGKAASMLNQDFHTLNKSGFQKEANLESSQFVTGFGDSVSNSNSNFSVKDLSGAASQVKLEQQGLHKSDSNSTSDELGKLNAADFVFSARNTDKVAESTILDIKDEVKFDGSRAPEKVCNSDFKFPFNLSDSSSKDHGRFVFTSHSTDFKFDIGLENKTDSKKEDVPNFTYSGKESNEIKSQPLDACLNDVFVFGASRSRKESNEIKSQPLDARLNDVFVFGASRSRKESNEIKSQPLDACLNDVFVFGASRSRKESNDIKSQPLDARPNDVFVFGASRSNGGIYCGGSTVPVNKINQLNRGKTEDCEVSELHNHNSGADLNSKLKNNGSSGDYVEQDPACSILNKMKKLNLGDSKVESTRSGSFTSNFESGANNIFVFGGNQNSSGFAPGSCFSKSNSESIRTYSSLSPSGGIGSELNSDGQEVPSIYKDENVNISFRSETTGLNSDSYCSTPKMNFSFSSNNLFPPVDNTNLKSLRCKKPKKKNMKVGQRTVVQQLFSQDQKFQEGSSQKNDESPGFGSPMDFSPYQDMRANNTPYADTGTGVKGESSANKKNISEHLEKPQDDESDSVLSPSMPVKDGLSAIRHRYKKKYRLKVGLNPTVQGTNYNKENVKQEPTVSPDEVCEHWRIRGNESYHAGELSKAEEFYSMGINSVPHVGKIGYPLPLKPLLLCYSNRAATRMSLGRMREAIADCTKASELDPDFLKVILRAGNCYLVLGEVKDAMECYTKCLRDGTSICLDRRITIEAADSLQKAKKVADYMHQSSTLLQEGTDDAAGRALGSIEEALMISRYSERLLQMKGEALYILRMYDEVVQLCERTLDIAEKNSCADVLANIKGNSSHVKLWRWHLQSMSHYRHGRLDLALDLIEKQGKVPMKSGDVTRESSIALATNIRELLTLKKSGNEAFNSGRYTEAIENYTAAISRSFDSRAFMAVCFCNRAAAHQSLGQIIDAISDCSVAIALDENYPKAISRRATLHEMIRDYKQALNDIQRLISLLETQSQSKSKSKSGGGSVRDLRKAHNRLASVEKKAKKESPSDLYLILGIKPSDAESEIKKAYRKAALRHHPDKAGQVLIRSDAGDDGKLWKECGEKIHNDSDRLFKIIGEAYAVLSDPSKRSEYDMEEEIRNNARERASNRNSGSCGHPSTSYSSPYERGGWSGNNSGTSYGRGSSRRNWYNNSRSQW